MTTCRGLAVFALRGVPSLKGASVRTAASKAGSAIVSCKGFQQSRDVSFLVETAGFYPAPWSTSAAYTRRLLPVVVAAAARPLEALIPHIPVIRTI